MKEIFRFGIRSFAHSVVFLDNFLSEAADTVYDKVMEIRDFAEDTWDGALKEVKKED